MRRASAFVWPWLASGSVPPLDSIRMSDQMIPVLMWTDATLEMLILISSLLNHDRLCRMTALSVTSMIVRNKWFPIVHRLALKISESISPLWFSTGFISTGFAVCLTKRLAIVRESAEITAAKHEKNSRQSHPGGLAGHWRAGRGAGHLVFARKSRWKIARGKNPAGIAAAGVQD